MALASGDCGTWLRENKRSPFAFFTNLKPICSTPMIAVSVKISAIVEEDTVFRCAEKWFSQVPNFSATGGETCEKMEHSHLSNSKPEVDIDFVPTVFKTLCLALKHIVTNVCQMAPRIRVNWHTARSAILWVYMFEVDFLGLCANVAAINFKVERGHVPLAMGKY